MLLPLCASAQWYNHLAGKAEPKDSVSAIVLPTDSVATDSLTERSLQQLEQDYAPIPVDDRYLYNLLHAPNIYVRYRYLADFKPLKQYSLEYPDDLNNTPQLAFQDTVVSRRIRQIDEIENARFNTIVARPRSIQNFYWRLPRPKNMAKYTNDDYIENLGRPIGSGIRKDIVFELKEKHWLHNIDGGIQFSQAYLSPNWYQGGNNNLTLLINAYWQVKLNQAFHPKLLFENTISYKLGLYSTPSDKYHKYSVSEDLFQWNMRAGIKAFNKWFYSIAVQYKTQLLHNYPQDSNVRSASFLSPGDFNIGLGMTFSTHNKSKSLNFNMSLAPLSYNLKTCLDRAVDPTQFGIPTGKRSVSEIGSSAEFVMTWKMTKNIDYRSRLFLFSDYKYFQGDWENTLSLAVNKWLSTQIYVHVRYDSSSDASLSKWKHWMLKEILSFGLRYTFSTQIK